MAKVLFFFTSSYPFGSGETFIENEIEYLAEAFDKVVIVSNDIRSEKTRDIPDNVVLKRKGYELLGINKVLSIFQFFNPEFRKELQVIRKTYKLKLSIPIINTMLQTLQKGKIWKKYLTRLINTESKLKDHIYLYSYWNNDMAFVIAKHKTEYPKVKTFSRMHGWDVYFNANEINYLPFRKYIFETIDQIFAISTMGKSYYTKLLPELSHKISVSHLGVKEYGINPLNTTSTFQLLSISNIIPIKNLFVLVKALSKLKIDFFWTHIGDGFMREELEALAQDLIPNKYIFKGKLTNQNVIQFLKSTPVDLFLNVSLSEGIPVSIMEAMSFGIPCMATNVGGNAEIVNNSNGVLLPPKPAPEIISYEIIKYANLNKGKREIIGQNAKQTFLKKYKADNNFKEFTQTIIQ